jgi:hypothetical protein
MMSADALAESPPHRIDSDPGVGSPFSPKGQLSWPRESHAVAYPVIITSNGSSAKRRLRKRELDAIRRSYDTECAAPARGRDRSPTTLLFEIRPTPSMSLRPGVRMSATTLIAVHGKWWQGSDIGFSLANESIVSPHAKSDRLRHLSYGITALTHQRSTDPR